MPDPIRVTPFPPVAVRITPPPIPPPVRVIVGGVSGSANNSALIAHLADTTPHPIYDDMPSLTLLFENGIV